MSQPRPTSSRPARRSVAPTRAQTRPAPDVRPAAAKSRVPKKTKPALDPNDVGVKRRARKRALRRRNNLVAWTVVAGISVVVVGAATGVWQEYQTVQQKIGVKEATLGDLRAQLERQQRRVGALKTREGKERALVEGGYLGQGERFLLFPKKNGQAKQ